MAASYEQFLKKDTTDSEARNNGDGTYKLITSSDITCDSNGNNILDGNIVKSYTCYSYLHTGIFSITVFEAHFSAVPII